MVRPIARWDEGWYSPALAIHSPNCNARPPGAVVDLVVIHNISLPPGVFRGDAIERLFTNRLDCSAHPFFRQLIGLEVSAHFLVRRDGALIQFVSCDQRAWHAGVSCWRGRSGCNDFSIGIEVEGSDERPFTGRQYARLAVLLRHLLAAYPVINGLAGHSEIAPDRKTDPGPHFDWERLLVASGLRAAATSLRSPGNVTGP
jgi:N-acetyl-anhydromuramoyl-L-alanine amidase